MQPIFFLSNISLWLKPMDSGCLSCLQAFHRLLLEVNARMVAAGQGGVVGPNGEPLPAWPAFNAARPYWMDHFLRVEKATRTPETWFPYKQWLSDGHSVRVLVTRYLNALLYIDLRPPSSSHTKWTDKAAALQKQPICHRVH